MILILLENEKSPKPVDPEQYADVVGFRSTRSLGARHNTTSDYHYPLHHCRRPKLTTLLQVQPHWQLADGKK